MRAAYLTATGPPESIMVDRLPVPAIGDDQVLIRVDRVAVNHVDTFIRSGRYPTPLPMPFVIGRDLAGAVTSLGSRVVAFRHGDRVWCNSLGHGGRQGSFAEFVAVDADRVYPLPDRVSADRVVAVAHAAATAFVGLHREARLQSGETVLVDGAAGAVGAAVIQLAAAAGARTIAVTSDRGLDIARQAGADRVLSRRDLATAGLDEAVDVWWDTTGRPDLNRTLAALRLRGRVVLVAGLQRQADFHLGDLYTRDLGLHGFAISNATVDDLRAAADVINRLLAAGRLAAQVHTTLPLGRAAQAHRMVELGVDGKILLRVGPAD